MGVGIILSFRKLGIKFIFLHKAIGNLPIVFKNEIVREKFRESGKWVMEQNGGKVENLVHRNFFSQKFV